MESLVDFTSSVFAFIEQTYGSVLIRKVKNKKNSNTVNRILKDCENSHYSAEKTGNKIIAMLRINPK